MRFLHTADLHIGNIFDSDDISYNIKRRNELIINLERMLAYCDNNNIETMLISGDLYESQSCSYDEIQKVLDLFEKYINIHILITAGNHDNYDDISWYKLLNWPKNVKIFSNDTWGYFQYRNVRIHGISWKEKHMDKDVFLDELYNLDKSYVNIMMIHGDIYDKNSQYLPLNVDNYINLGFDYIALGHIHKKEIGLKYGYPGIPEPIKYGQNYRAGFIVGDTDTGKIELAFIPYAIRRYYNLELELLNDTNIELEAKINAQINDLSDGDCLKITLSGYSESFNLDEFIESYEAKPYKITIQSELSPAYVDSSLINNKYYKEFVNRIRAKNLDSDVEKIALDLGLVEIIKEGLNNEY